MVELCKTTSTTNHSNTYRYYLRKSFSSCDQGLTTAQAAEMSNIDVKAASWRLVEVGRVVLFMQGENAGRLAAIVEIIDHKRVYDRAE